MHRLDHNALHVINGDIAAGTFRQALTSSNRLIVLRDVLSCGPIPAFLDVEGWRQQRFDFWKQVVAHDPQFTLRPSPSDLLENVQRIADASRVYAWAASGNTDQLMVAFLFELLERMGSDPGKIELIEVSRLPPNDRRVMAMGELEASEMRMHPAPRTLKVAEWTTYRQAWHALSATDPLKLQAFVDQPATSAAWLRAAVRLMLRRYPERASGLNHWDRQLLHNVRARGPRAGRVIGYTMGENLNEGDLTGDLYLFWRLLRMGSASLPKPLLTVFGDNLTIQGANVEVTEFGAAVLDGKASVMEANPVDDWAGGVHLSSAGGNVWFNEGGRLKRG